MQKLQNKPVVVIFAEESLSVEDFSWKDEAGKGSFPNLESISSESDGLTYLPFVHAPLHAFRHHLPVQGREWYNLKLGPSSLSNDDIALNETLLYVNLDDAASDEDRPDLLKRHDAVISKVYRALAERHGDVLAVYTAHHSSWQTGEETPTRRIRHLLATDLEAGDEKAYGNNRTLLYAPTMILTIGQKSTTLENGIVGGDEDLIINFPDNITVVFSFENTKSPGYWSLQGVHVTVQNELYNFSDVKIGAPLEFSYHCSQEVVFNANDNKLNISNDFQIQPYIDGRRFGAAYDCVYFFTVPIWSGLFVCTVFTIIMIFGLGMIMDIKTMDRFDDPKGKTITINVAD
ncbi:V-type proton ATPase subunit S1 [Cryptotermes secundus]|nr:V-type proton ATPase subunit S1 [Cryptotermes secundus]